MPQLDKVTFLSQFFWLCVFYLGFYYIVLKFYLPKISRILALRRRKMGFSQEGMISLQQENHKVKDNYDLVFSRALTTSKNLFNTFFSRTSDWLNTNASTINKDHYRTVNVSYIHSLGESSLSQNLLFYHAAQHLPGKLSFKHLIKQLRDRSPLNTSKTEAIDTKKLKKK